MCQEVAESLGLRFLICEMRGRDNTYVKGGAWGSILVMLGLHQALKGHIRLSRRSSNASVPPYFKEPGSL